MRPDISIKRKKSNDKGFTIVELLIALMLTGIVAIGIYNVYNMFYAQTTTQDRMVEAQQNARVAINLMEREMVNAGYAVDGSDIILEATGSSIQFQYVDPSTPTTPVYIKYAVNANNELERTWDDPGDGVGVGESLSQIIPNVRALTISYYDENGNVIGTPVATQADRNTIRFINVALTTETTNVLGLDRKSFIVETQIRLRNLGVGQAASDTSEPSVPQGLQVRDPGQCGRLKVKWTENTEGDIAGYKIYYGAAAGSYLGVVNVPVTLLSGNDHACTDTGSSIECTIHPMDTVFTDPSNPTSVDALNFTSSDGAQTGTTYFVSIKAYDRSLNHSDFAAPVSGNPTPSNSTFGSGDNDTTVQPVKPVAVTGLTAVDGPADGQVQLSWTAYNTSSSPDVTGFRIYRSESPFTTYPIDPNAVGISWIAAEPGRGKPEVGETDTSYLDTSAGLIGCRVYYYAIAPANCDESLISDAGGDPVSKKYVQANYDATCGNGTDACSPGTDFAAEAGSDTAPDNSVAPQAPADFAARAGWKRVALTFKQPSDSDLAQTCVYSNTGNTHPELQTDTVSFPKLSGCYQVNTVSTPNGIRIFESDGIFDTSEVAANTSTSFWHNSMSELTATPSLQEEGTYSYRAVAFDLCGNASAITGAQATTTLCGEDPVGKPDAVTALTASYCNSPVTLNWTEVRSEPGVSDPDNHPDLAGYRIFRSTDNSDWTGATLVNSGAPSWGASSTDGGATEGGVFYYKVASTDCPYEKGDDTGGVAPTSAQIRNHVISEYLKSAVVGPVYPGKIDRDEKCEGIGSCVKDNHRAVVTGVQVNADNSVTPESGMTHNKVTLFLSNTSQASMTIQNATVYWDTVSADLREINIGGGRSPVSVTTTSLDASLSIPVASGDFVRQVSNAALTPAAINGSARYVPITLKFLDSSNNAIDMRNRNIKIVLSIRNDQSGTTGCTSYMTISQVEEGIYVPLGPDITSAQQNQPASPTFAYAVPGSNSYTVPNGSYGPIEVTGGTDVTITVNVNAGTPSAYGDIAVTSAKLYWKATALTETTAPSSGYTEVNMANASGNYWSGVIPAADTSASAKRLWYYVVAYDADGNFDRSPEISQGAYTYDQKPFDPCDLTPSAPASTVSAYDIWPGADHAVFKWPRVTTYTNGDAINTAVDPIVYQVWRRSTVNGAFTKVYEVPDNAPAEWQMIPAGSTIAPATSSWYVCNPSWDATLNGWCVYWDYLDATTNDMTYYIVTENSCNTSADANSSSDSPQWRECQGSGSAVISVSPASILSGESYTITVNDCGLSGGVSSTITMGNRADIGNILYSQNITEAAANNGVFTGTVSTVKVSTDSSGVYVSPNDTTNDIVRVSCSAGCSGSPATQTVTVSAAPCDFNPSAPTGLGGSRSGNDIVLTWNANAEGDLSYYKVYRSKNGAAFTYIGMSSTPGYRDTPAQINTNSYIYKVTAVDTCPLESAQSSSSPDF